MATKQEEIREWYKDALSGYGCPDTYLENETDKLFTYLHSQGCVLKVDRKLPSIWNSKGKVKSALTYKKELAGYTAWESLIEVKE